MATQMKTALKILFVVSMASLIAACGPQGNKNNAPAQNQQNQMSSNEGSHHHGGKLRRICAADIQKFCNGQNKVRKCLRNISDQLQPDCKTALAQAIERRKERKLQREQRNNTNNTQMQQPTQNQPNTTQPQNQAAPQNTQHTNSSNDDDDDDN
jgi:hypothetical protein